MKTLPPWLRLVRRRLFGPVSAAARRKARKASQVRPRLEALEDRLAPASFQSLYSFTGGSDGMNPYATVMVDSNGKIDGTTFSGNVFGAGSVFQFDPSSKGLTVLHPFSTSTETWPTAALIQDSSGNFYGTTRESSGGQGTVFKLSSDGSNFTILHNFSPSNGDGRDPYGSVTMDSKGNLFGTTAGGGAKGDYGTVFELSPNANGGYDFSILYSFSGGSDGWSPQSGVFLDGNGNLYGTTVSGGTNGDGTVYKLSPNGNGGYDFSSLHSFSGGDGNQPISNLVMDGSGNLYGTTTIGGPNNTGVVFELNPSNKAFSVIHSFQYSVDGYDPSGNLVIDSSGNLYGTNQQGGSGGQGTVYELSPNGLGGFSLTVLHALAASDGAGPYGGLFADSSGNLYGTTIWGGTNNDGTIFELPGVISVASPTTTAANNATAVFSTNTQNVNLTADVTSSAGPVNEGTVTFTVMQGSTVIGSATTSNTVNNGAASVSYALPSSLAAGTYTIDAVYNPGPDFIGSSDDSHTLTVTAASTTTAASSATATFSTSTQNATLTADVTSSVGPVNEGTVTFTVMQGSNVIGTATTSDTVNNGTASVSYALPAGQAAGTYTIDAVYNPGPDFTGSSDDTQTLILSPASTGIGARNTTAEYSTSPQNATLKASVFSSAGPVNEGTVTFTVLQGSTVIGTATTSGTVTNGQASVGYALPAGQAAGLYSIFVAYNPGPDFTSSAGFGSSLDILPADATTTAEDESAAFSPNAQSVTLTAGVSSSAGPVNEGTVTFTVMQGSTVIGTATTSNTVTNGQASVSYALPGGTSAGNYTIDVGYSDSGGNFTDNGDTNASLTVSPAKVTTSAIDASASYSPNSQSLTLNATLADDSFSGDAVDEGAVTFTIVQDARALGSVQGTVSGGKASAAFSLAAGQAVGNYTIDVRYSDSAGNFIDSSDTNGTLTIKPANVTVTAVAPSTVVYSTNAQNMTLSATVADSSIPSDVVNEGSVLFTILNGNSAIRSIAGTVANGTATAAFTLPAGQAAGSYTIDVGYSDSPSNFIDGGDTGATLIVNPANVSTTANPVTATYSQNAQTLMLSARVADTSNPTDTVDEGTVTFTVLDGSNPPVSVQGLVTGGAANAAFTLPAGQDAGKYILEVSYGDSAGNFSDSSDTSATLTVFPDKVAALAGNISTSYSPNTQTLTLSANIDNLSFTGQAVGEGVVTFTVQSSKQTLGSVQGTVSGGTANAAFTLPAGQAIGNYTIGVRYSDSASNFFDSGDYNGTLTVSPSKVTTTASNVSTVYGTNSQTLDLSAAVADTGISTDTVNEGTVTFTVQSGSTTLGSVQAAVSGGTANTNFTLPAGQAAGSYTIDVSYNDGSGNFLDSGDSNGTLTVSPAQVTTTANIASVVYSANTQILKLSAGLDDASVPSDIVNEGAVTFTVQSGGTNVGSVVGLVSGGTAHADLTLPAALASGSYTIGVRYSDSAGNFTDGGDTNASLSVGSVNVAATASASSVVYSPGAQTVTLSAVVANTSDASVPVNEGVVTFTVLSGSSPLGSVQGAVRNGTASAAFTLPPGLANGSYTIDVSYSDTLGNFTDSSDQSATLTVSPANVAATAANANATFSTMPQTVTLSAVVAEPGEPAALAAGLGEPAALAAGLGEPAASAAGLGEPAASAAGLVGEGVVTFTVLNGNTIVGSVQGSVGGGTANANITLPGGLAAGSYTIVVRYSDSQGNFRDSGDTNATLTIVPAGTIAQLTQVSLAPTLLSMTTTETLTAHVSSSTAVTHGTVTFLVSNHTITANVDGNGNATAVVTMPMLALLGPQDISIRYDNAADNRSASTDSQTAAWHIFNPIAPSTATFAPNSDSVTADLFGLFITYTNGVLMEIDYGSMHLVFSYNAAGQLAQVTFDGMNLL